MDNIKLRNWIPGQARNDILFGITFLALIAFICLSTLSYAGNIPQVINYSGTLTNTDGTPANGNYNMEFKIYNAASGGVALWTEKWDTTTSQVTVVNGGFNVMLGHFAPIPMSFFEANFDADHPAVLGIKVGTDFEMTPRQQITSVGYSFTAGNEIPKGGIIMWSGSFAQIPYGWGLCDGLEKTALDGSKVTPPDLQNRFIVGWECVCGWSDGRCNHT